MRGTMGRIRSQTQMRDHVSELLKKNQITSPPVPVEQIARSLKASIRYSPYEGEIAGVVLRDEKDIVIGVNSLQHPNRQRFTIAHECGHILFHQGKEVHIDRSFRVNLRDETSSKATDPEEIEANRFAAELLMPHDMIKSDLANGIDITNEDDIEKLAKKYRVSAIAMTFRIKTFLSEI